MIRRLVLAAAAAAFVAASTRTIAAQGAPAGAAAAQNTLPLKTARTHTFTTTRGTWISLDVSPDGQQIVFDLLGDLYTLPISGGKATRLTSGLPYDAQPRYSPDGKRIAFVSDRSGGDNVWIMSLDGKDTLQVTKGNDNLYSSPMWMRRQVHRRLEGRGPGRREQALDVSRGWRERRRPRDAAGAAEDAGRGGRQGSALRLVRGAHG